MCIYMHHGVCVHFLFMFFCVLPDTKTNKNKPNEHEKKHFLKSRTIYTDRLLYTRYTNNYTTATINH